MLFAYYIIMNPNTEQRLRNTAKSIAESKELQDSLLYKGVVAAAWAMHMTIDKEFEECLYRVMKRNVENGRALNG